ncbi:hypothetical protein EK35_10445 [Listeria monocytogenes]|nr:hypothetical protein [Listeria monocytogenes]EAF2900824.1 hypothetical protein [Listeria monocytogenes]EAH1511400.1 hypothetical protein [Listeria monocytogenes]EAW7177430.1 hypothetical protein [Listeria monocytogenes]EBD1566312.1 hypothetical protein [Listeria monocytogenes]
MKMDNNSKEIIPKKVNFYSMGNAMCSFLYEQEGVSYSKIQPNRSFMVMEGASVVGRRKIVSFNL